MDLNHGPHPYQGCAWGLGRLGNLRSTLVLPGFSALITSRHFGSFLVLALTRHASIKTTLDTYGHLFDGLDEAAADRLDATWRAARADAPLTRPPADVIVLPRQ